MKPYYDEDVVQLWLGDCREVLREIGMTPHATVTDPPYGETSLGWDKRVDGWLDLSLGRSLWCFGSLRSFMAEAAAFRAADWRMSQEIVWEKHNGSGMASDRFRRVHELAAHFYRGPWGEVYKEPQFTHDAAPRVVRRKALPPQWQGARGPTVYRSEDGGPRLMRSVVFARTEHHEAFHPTQKPIEVLLPLIAYSCPLDGCVLDPFAGSGSTLVAAKQIRRRAVGVEVDERYAEITARRLSQMTLEFEFVEVVS